MNEKTSGAGGILAFFVIWYFVDQRKQAVKNAQKGIDEKV